MATKQDRGTKRTCQNRECGARFYDLNRSPITCPICGSAYRIASSPTALAAVLAEEKAPRKVKKDEVVEKVVAEGEPEEALADVEADEAVAEDDERPSSRRKRKTAATCRTSSAARSQKARSRKRGGRAKRGARAPMPSGGREVVGWCRRLAAEPRPGGARNFVLAVLPARP